MSDALQNLLDREAQICADLRNPDVKEITVPAAFFAQQIGLHTIMADPIGRIWDVTASPIRMIFDPLFLTRKKENRP